MIVQKTFEINGVLFVHTYSNAGRYVVGGEPPGEYVDACDPAEFNRQYTEGNLIPADQESELESKAEAYDILMGASE